MRVVTFHSISLLQPFLGGGEFTNAISGRIMLGKETLVTISGHWDEEIFIKDKRTGVIDIFYQILWWLESNMSVFPYKYDDNVHKRI